MTLTLTLIETWKGELSSARVREAVSKVPLRIWMTRLAPWVADWVDTVVGRLSLMVLGEESSGMRMGDGEERKRRKRKRRWGNDFIEIDSVIVIDTSVRGVLVTI